MTQEKIDKANQLQREIDKYERAIRYAHVNDIRFTGMTGISDLSSDKELAQLIYDHCKRKKAELIKEYEEL